LTVSPTESILKGLQTESEEEFGCSIPGEHGEAHLLGLFPNRDTYGTNALYIGRTNLNFGQIRENWSKAQDRYEHDSLLSLTRG